MAPDTVFRSREQATDPMSHTLVYHDSPLEERASSPTNPMIDPISIDSVGEFVAVTFQGHRSESHQANILGLSDHQTSYSGLRFRGFLHEPTESLNVELPHAWHRTIDSRELAGRSTKEGWGTSAIWSSIGRHSDHSTGQNVKNKKLDHRVGALEPLLL